MKDYTLKELRDLTESYVKHIKPLFCESLEVPTYDEIKAAYNPPADSEYATKRIIPNRLILKTAYSIFNQELFEGKLPTYINLNVETNSSKTWFGWASYRYDTNWNSRGSYDRYILTPTGITLNSRYQMTFHEWLEVILHECVHIFEYVTHPEPFLKFDRRGRNHYDAHGWWFQDVGHRFDNLGFDVRRYCTAASDTYEINTEDATMNAKVQKSKSNYLIANMVGLEEEHEGACIKISRQQKAKLENFVMQGREIGRKFWVSIKRIDYYTTENPMLVNMKGSAIRNVRGGVSYYFFDGIKEKYGPFTLESSFKPEDKEQEVKSLGDIRVRFFQSVKPDMLVQKIFRAIVMRNHLNSYDLPRGSSQYIKPVIKTPVGMPLMCNIMRAGEGIHLGKLHLDSNGYIMHISREWIREMYEHCNGGGCFDDYNFYSFYKDAKDEKQSSSKAINTAIDWVISDGYDRDETPDSYGHDEEEAKNHIYEGSEIEEYVKMEVAKAVFEYSDKILHPKEMEESMNKEDREESFRLDEDIDEVDIEDRNTIADDYARNVWNIKGVIDVKKVGKDSVEVQIA